MPTVYPQNNVPEEWDCGGNVEHGERTWVLTHGDDTHTNSIWPGCWVVKSTNGYIAVASSFATSAYEVVRIRDVQNQSVNIQLVSTDALNATGAVFELEVKAVGGRVFKFTEDDLATPISDDPTNGWPGKPYVPVLVTDPTDTDAYAPTRAPQGKYLLDSSAITTTTSGTTSVQIIGVAPIPQGPYSATASANPRVFLCKALSPAQSL